MVVRNNSKIKNTELISINNFESCKYVFFQQNDVFVVNSVDNYFGLCGATTLHRELEGRTRQRGSTMSRARSHQLQEGKGTFLIVLIFKNA